MNIATISIEPGSPGTESAYWVQALADMYAKWAELNGCTWEMYRWKRGIRVLVAGRSSDQLCTERGHHCCTRERGHTVFVRVSVKLDAPTRTYVLLDSNQLAKDWRTGRETEDVQAVLAGHLELLDAPEKQKPPHC